MEFEFLVKLLAGVGLLVIVIILIGKMQGQNLSLFEFVKNMVVFR